MRKKDKEAIFSLIIFMLFVFYTGGLKAVWVFICNMVQVVWLFFIMLNSVAIEATNDSIITLLLKSSITFGIVGIILEAINAPRGKVGSIFGKALFWVVGFPVSIILNFIGSLIF
ncbi:MAG: hypothetical protein ACM3O4_05620 [Ignavibacteriales bacterium]